MYRIGGFARLSQVPVKTLRYYDELGLLRPARTERGSGYRYYTAAQLETLNRILAFKDLGFSLREIRGLLAEAVPPAQVRGMLRLRIGQLERGIERERARLGRLRARLAVSDACGPAPDQDVAVRQVGPRLVASMRATLRSHDECEGLFEELDHHLGGRSPRARGAVWHACEDGAVDCEALVFLPSFTAPRGRVRVYEMPAHAVASLVYRSGVDYRPAYRAIRTWLETSGVPVVGPKREVFLDEGGPEAPVTEIQFPIAAPGGDVPPSREAR